MNMKIIKWSAWISFVAAFVCAGAYFRTEAEPFLVFVGFFTGAGIAMRIAAFRRG